MGECLVKLQFILSVQAEGCLPFTAFYPLMNKMASKVDTMMAKSFGSGVRETWI